jgi:4-amino-4-deoxy-L-arabinose transferase-like glycosyltransferase
MELYGRAHIAGFVRRHPAIWPWLAGSLFFCGYLAVILCQKQLVNHDATVWVRYGQQLFHGGLERFAFWGGTPEFSPLVWTPGYPFLVGLVDLFLGHAVLAAYLVSALAGAGLTVVVYYLVRDLFADRELAGAALLLTGCYPPLVSNAVSTLISSTAFLWLFLALYLSVRLWRDGRIRWACGAGAVMGLAILTRFEYGLYFLVGMGLAIVGWRVRRHGFGPVVGYALSGLLVYALYALPLYHYSGYKLFSPYLTNNIFKVSLPDKPNPHLEQYRSLGVEMRALLYNRNTAQTYNLLNQNRVKAEVPEGNPVVAAAAPVSPQWRTWLLRYGGLVRNVFPEILLKPFILFAAGVVGLIVARQWLAAGFIGSMIGATFVFFPPLGGADSARYYGPVLPFVVIMSTTGLWYLARVVARARWRIMAYTLLAAILVVCVYKDTRSIQAEYTPQEQAWLACAQWLDTQAAPGSIIICRKNYPAFYSGLRTEWLPDEDLPAVRDYANHIGAAYLIVDKQFTCALMPQYTALLEATLPSALRVVYEYDPRGAYHTRILAWQP